MLRGAEMLPAELEAVTLNETTLCGARGVPAMTPVFESNVRPILVNAVGLSIEKLVGVPLFMIGTSGMMGTPASKMALSFGVGEEGET